MKIMQNHLTLSLFISLALSACGGAGSGAAANSEIAANSAAASGGSSATGSGSSSGSSTGGSSSSGSNSSSGNGGASGSSTGGTSSAGPLAFVYSPYKDVGISQNWNANIISSVVTGTSTALAVAMPSNLKTVTLAFATGECGSENWSGVAGSTLASGNIQALVNAGKKYIIATGGGAGVFTCGTDAGFLNFIQTYYSANMVGVDFDIEGGQTVPQIEALVARVQSAQRIYPNMRFSFTVSTLGASGVQNLSFYGIEVMKAIKNAGLNNYIINLMTMDYGSSASTNCVLNSNGLCDMGASAIAAATSLNTFHQVPFSQIEITPMIGGNDTMDEVFTLADVDTVAAFVLRNKLAGVHFWSFDRDKDCPPGVASPVCNTYGQSGTLGFTNAFGRALGF